MAMEIDKDGKQVVGGIAAVRDAFVKAGQGKLSCLQATMSYELGQYQVLYFVGKWNSDGRPFDASTTVPPGAALAPYAEQLARDLLNPIPAHEVDSTQLDAQG